MNLRYNPKLVPPHRIGRHVVIGIALAALLGGLSSDADAGRRKSRKRSNMPENWSWPPSRQMRKAGKRCLRELTAVGVKWKKGPRTAKIATPIVLPTMEIGQLKLTSIFRKPPFVMDCHLALAFAQHGHILTEAGVSELRFTTIHMYRRVRLGGKTRRALSRHALGLAMDVFEIVTQDGTKLVIEDDYASAPLLPDVEAKLWASGAFRGLLTPGNDRRSHSDHFHFEAKLVIDDKPQARKSRASRRAARVAARQRLRDRSRDAKHPRKSAKRSKRSRSRR